MERIAGKDNPLRWILLNPLALHLCKYIWNHNKRKLCNEARELSELESKREVRGLESKHCWKKRMWNIEASMRMGIERERYLHCVRGVIHFNIILLVLTRIGLKLSLL